MTDQWRIDNRKVPAGFLCMLLDKVPGRALRDDLRRSILRRRLRRDPLLLDLARRLLVPVTLVEDGGRVALFDDGCNGAGDDDALDGFARNW